MSPRVYVHLGSEKQRPMETQAFTPFEFAQVRRAVEEAHRDERPVRVQVGERTYTILDQQQQRELMRHLRALCNKPPTNRSRGL